MTAGLVLNEFDVNLPSLATRLVVVVVIIICSSADSRSFDAAVVGAVAVTCRVAEIRRMSVWVGNVGHVRAKEGVVLTRP